MKYKIGQSAEFSKTISESDVYTFAGITGDFNEVHINEVAAKKSVFGQRVVHGALTASLISTVLGTILPGSGCIYLSQESRFLKPVKIGETVTARVEINEIDGNKLTLTTQVFNQEHEIVLDGLAKVKVTGE